MTTKRLVVAAVSLCAFIALGITTKRVILHNAHVFKSTVIVEGAVTHEAAVTNSGAVTNSAAVTNSSTVLNSGAVTNSSTVATAGTVTNTGTTYIRGSLAVDGGAAFYGGVIFDGGTVEFSNVSPPTIGLKNIVTSHTLLDAGVAPLALEMHQLTLSGGTATYVFATAFSGIPICTCSDTTITTAAPCNTNAATASQVVLFGSATAIVNVICVGIR